MRLRVTASPGRVRCCLLLASLLLAVSACAQSGARPSLLNKKAPQIARLDLSGQRISLAELRGNVVLLNFWATWCAPCQAEMPIFAGWQRTYGPRGLAVVGVSMDDDAAPVRRVLARLKIDYPVVMGDARLGERYHGVLGMPETFLIDRSGVVRAQFQGGGDLKAMEAKIRLMLAQR